MEPKIIRKSILLSIVLVVGAFFIIGSMGGGTGGSSAPKPTQIDTSKMSDAKKAELSALQKKKDELESEIIVLNDKIWESTRSTAQKWQPEDGIFNLITDPGGFLKGQKADQAATANKVKKSDAIVELKHVESQIDKIANESKKNCFPGETKILLSSGEYKDISMINIGDRIMAYDIAKDRLVDSFVKHVYVDDNNHYYIINEGIRATAYERFLSKKGCKKIRDLTVGDEIFNGNGYETVRNIKKVNADLKVFNLNINSSHNFFVSNNGRDTNLLVHNSSGGGGGK